MERERIRKRKEDEKLPRPWSDDPIFRSTRFTNIRREDDKVTKWIKHNWREPYQNHTSLPFAMCMARMINWPDTLEYLGFPEVWEPQRFIDEMTDRSMMGHKVWTSAYMVTGGYSEGGETKQQIIARVLNNAWLRAPKIVGVRALGEAQYILEGIKGMGTFLCAQVIADLKYTPILAKATDWYEFCAPGPGSTMGLNFLAGRDQYKTISPINFYKEVNRLRPLIKQETGYDLTAHDAQNCLCEFSKYVRIKYLGGRGKTGYDGG
jgi:hypothetical protein